MSVRVLALPCVFVAKAALAQMPGPAITVSPADGRHRINPAIYGMAEYGVSPAWQAAARLGVLRWGGDGTTRYNWQVDSSNAGFDWYFIGGSGTADPTPSGGPDALVRADQATHSATLLTVPIIPWINNSAAWSCSFPVDGTATGQPVYGAQQSTDPYLFPDGETCGNSIATDGTQLTDTDITANDVANSPDFEQGWIAHLVATFGTARAGGVRYYQLDNEPYGWGNTHRDVEPGGADYPTIATLGGQYALMLKQTDPSATILGPSDFTLGGWIGNPPAQGGLFAGQYYLQAMEAAGAAAHRRLLDDFDEHYYFNFTDQATQLASTRTLWDPTYNGGTWVEQYEFHGNMMLIPRFQQWIAQYYPGTGIAFSEYSIDSGRGLITDALAEADVLGIFGWQGVDLAAMWNPPAPTYPTAFSFLLYRNYDGAGHGFGDVSVSTTSADPTTVAAFGALRGAHTLTLVLINKSATSALAVPISVAGLAGAARARAWQYTAADLTAIVRAGDVAFSGGAATVTLPAWSMTMLVLPLS